MSIMESTVSPVEVFQKASSDTGPQGFYFALEFPDFQYCSQKLRVVIGRSDEDLSNLEKEDAVDLRLGGDEEDGSPGPHKRTLDIYEDDLESIPEMQGSSTKRRKITSSNDEEGEWSSGLEDVPQHSTRNHLTAVGGIGGPQIRSDDPEEDFVGVHPQVDEVTGEMHVYTISKKHLVIRWDDEHGWMMDILGRNGAFLNREWYKQGDAIVLHHQDEIALRSLPFRFHEVLAMRDEGSASELSDLEDSEEELEAGSDTATTTTDGEEDDNEENVEALRNGSVDVGSKSAKSLNRKSKVLVNSEGDALEEDSEQDGSRQPKTPKSKQTSADEPRKTLKLKTSDKKDKGKGAGKSLGKGKGEKAPASKSEKSTSSQPLSDAQDAVASVELPQKKRGPGRPPADGIMSKRERKERERADQAGIPYGEPLPEKIKGRTRTGSTANANSVEIDAAASAKRPKKSKRETSGVPEADEERNESKTPKREATPEPPKPPSPKESDYPPERLVKPDETYQQLLYQVLSEAKGPMALPQIYEDMKNRWPHFRFVKETKGWESSVRHNLQSCPCFMKGPKAGKGYMWVIDPNVPYEKKSKRADPPNPVSSAYQPHKPTMLPHPGLHQPVHGLGTNPYAYGQGYPGTNMSHVSFPNGQRTQNQQQHLQFSNTNNPLPHGQQPRPQLFVNGHQLLPPHQSLPVHGSQTQPSANYSSPYASNSAPQPQTPQVMNSKMQNGTLPNHDRNNTTPAMSSSINSAHQTQQVPQAAPMQWNISTNGTPPSSNSPYPRLGTPVSAGQTPARLGGQVVIEPPAIGELRAGRMPAIVNRFFTQLRKMTGADVDRTVRQAELSVQWILKHPDSDEGLDQELLNFGAPKSMVDVIRKLVDQQSQSSMEQSTSSQRGVVAGNGPIHNIAGGSNYQALPVSSQANSQIKHPQPAASLPIGSATRLTTAQPSQGNIPVVRPTGATVISGPVAGPLPTQSPAPKTAVASSEQENKLSQSTTATPQSNNLKNEAPAPAASTSEVAASSTPLPLVSVPEQRPATDLPIPPPAAIAEAAPTPKDVSVSAT